MEDDRLAPETLRKYYGSWATDDLLMAVTVNKSDYKPEVSTVRLRVSTISKIFVVTLA